MNTISIEQLAEKLHGNLWTKGDLKRIYLDKGYNTKKMSTKTYVYQNASGEFKVSCKIDCPSQAWQWIESQQDEIITGVEESIKIAFFEIENPDVDYYDHLENEKQKEELNAFETNIDTFRESFKNDYVRAINSNESYQKQLEAFSNMDDASKLKIEELKAERKSILCTPGSAKRSTEIKKAIAAFPSQPFELNEWIKKAITFSTADEYANFKIEEKRKSFNVVQDNKEVIEENNDTWQAIHISYVNELVGKTITWKAPAYRMNNPYEGVAKIISADASNRMPFKTETISGDELDYAFVDEYARGDAEGILCYSDGDRFVTYQIVSND